MMCIQRTIKRLVASFMIDSGSIYRRYQSADIHRCADSECRRSPGSRVSPALPARQLGDLNEIAAGVVQLGDGRARHLGRRHREFGAARFDALAVAFDVVSEEHRRGLALLEHFLLIGLGRRDLTDILDQADRDYWIGA